MGLLLENFRTCVTIQIKWRQSSTSTEAFIDSGAVENFMDIQWAKEHNIPLLKLETPRQIAALDGRPLGSGSIQSITEPLSVTIAFRDHSEEIQFFLTDSPSYPVVLGHTWLAKHKPLVNWGGTGETILQWSSLCETHCRHSSQHTLENEAGDEVSNYDFEVGGAFFSFGWTPWGYPDQGVCGQTVLVAWFG